MAPEKLVELRIPAKAERLGMVRDVVKRSAESAGCDASLSDKLVIAVNEACMNVIQHAYKGSKTGDIVMEVTHGNGWLSFRLVDFADPIDLDKVKSRDLDEIKPGGLGVHFIREIMDDIQMGHLEQGLGNFIEMAKKLTDTS